LELGKDDPVLRRLLARKLERMVQDISMGVEPTDEELKAYFEAHADDYLEPEWLTLTQIYFDPDKRGDDTLADAEAAKLKLQASEDPVEASSGMGDSFMLQSYFPGRSQQEVAKVLGQGFADSVFKLSAGEWHGPVLSGYGVHLVYIHSRQEAVMPEFAAVKDRVLEDWKTQRRIDFTEEYVDTLMDKYTVVIEETE
jgi:parvulin-like peptidyl-prolyl isomerase